MDGLATVPKPSRAKARAWLDRRARDIERERAPFMKVWREAGDYYLPTRPRTLASDQSRPNARAGKIFDNTATIALRTMVSGLLAGMASPARPWFDLAVPEGEVGDDKGLAEWLRTARDTLLATFDRSNLYTELGALFESGGLFGTGAMAILPDAKKIMRFQAFPIGSYSIAQALDGRVDTFVRELPMTLRQVVGEFGLENLTQTLQHAWKAQAYERKVTICHAIWPMPEGERSDHDFQEVYWEKGDNTQGGEDTPDWGGAGSGSEPGDGILKVSGYYEFPIVVLRWDRNHEDVWATNSPGLSALADVKQLQSMTKRYTNAAEKTINPPLNVDPSLRSNPISLLPGAINYGTEGGGGEGVKPTHEFRYDFSASHDLIEQTRNRIRETFYTNLFLMLLSDARATPPTAEEVRAREREKMTVLGPILERFSDDVFDPLIDRAAAMLMRLSAPDWFQGMDGILPMPPDAVLEAGADIRVEYTSEVAAAQRMAGMAPIERWMQQIGGMAELNPAVLDVPDWDGLARDLGRVAGINPARVRDEDVVMAERQQRAQAQQQAAMAEQAPQMARAARDLSETQVGDTTAIDGIVEAALRDR